MSLYTIKNNGQHEIIIEKSRFICHAEKVDSKEAAFEFIKAIKKQYWDATHNCSAFIIGENMDIQGSSDDGEPSGTAGIPMLEVLKKNNLHNIAVTVTRYFGGIKLGAGGLVRAYGKSVSQTIQEIGIVEKVLIAEYHLLVSLLDIGRITNILYRQDCFQISDIEYENTNAIVKLNFAPSQLPKITATLTEIMQQDVELKLHQSYYIEQNI